MERDATSISSSQTNPERDVLKGDSDGPELEKKLAIESACAQSDIPSLKALAESEGGFLTDDLRRRAWPILLGHAPDASNESAPAPNSDAQIPWQKLPPHRDECQVQLDVERSFIYYPENMSDSELSIRKSELSDLIVEVLRRDPFLCYVQGYHDICQVFLLVLDPPVRAPALTRLSLLRIRDFMLPNFSATTAQLRLIPDIIKAADPTLREHLAGTKPYYALAGTLTMYAHNIEGYRDIVRLFDVLLAREPVFSVYLFAQIVLSRREELLETPNDDTTMLGFIVSKIPKDLDLESLISDAITLFDRYPPSILRAWRRISSSSCLKTARSAHSCATQSLEDGRHFFEMQANELRRAEKWNKIVETALSYRKKAGAVGLAAVLVGVAAVYLHKHPGPVNYLTGAFWRWLGSGN